MGVGAAGSQDVENGLLTFRSETSETHLLAASVTKPAQHCVGGKAEEKEMPKQPANTRGPLVNTLEKSSSRRLSRRTEGSGSPSSP